MAEKEELTTEIPDEKPKLLCGFCRRGAEVNDVCGKLWHDSEKACTAHQRCMQYSAGLVQYTMKRFGGFKVARVFKEQNRGKRLKCSICVARHKKKHGGSGAATAGCAWHKCRKTFHFYCARTSSSAIACKMIETRENGEKIDNYCVFCCDEHKEMYKKKLKNPVKHAEDTDDDAYKTDAKSSSTSSSSSEADESDASSPSSDERSNRRDRGSLSEKSKRRQRIISSDSVGSGEKSAGDECDEGGALDRNRGTEKLDARSEQPSAGEKRKSTSEDADSTQKRPKVESASSDDGSRDSVPEYVICFVEQAERVNGSVKEALERAACSRFNVPPSSVYVWQYNGQPLTGEHFIYLLNDIGKALAVDDSATVSRLIFSMQISDVAEFDKKIAHNSTLDAEARRALYRGLRQQIARNFKKATELKGRRVCSYCHIGGSSDYDKEVAFVLITKDLAALGAVQETNSSSSDDGSLEKNLTQNAEGKHSKDLQSVTGACGSGSGREEKHVKKEAAEAEVADEKGKKNAKTVGQATTSVVDESRKKEVKLTGEKKGHDNHKSKGTAHRKESDRKPVETDFHKKDKDADNKVKSCEKHLSVSAKTKMKDKERAHKSSRKTGGEVQKSALKTDHVKAKSSEDSSRKAAHRLEHKKDETKVGEADVLGRGDNLKDMGNKQCFGNLPALVTEKSRIGEKVADEKSGSGKTAQKPTDIRTEQRDFAVNTDGEPGKETVSEGAQTDCIGEGCTAVGRIIEILVPAPVSGFCGAALEVENSVAQDSRMFGSLFVWDDSSVLASSQRLTDAEKVLSQETEFDVFKQYIVSRIDATTILRQFPTASDARLLSPEDTVKSSVTRRLVDFFLPEKGDSPRSRLGGAGGTGGNRKGNGPRINPNRCEAFEMEDDERKPGSASSVTFIGPFDRAVIQHDEYVRQRIADVVDSSLWSTSADGGDVICVTDVGCDVQLVRVADVIGATRLPRDVSCRALFGVDPRRESASSVLLLFTSASSSTA